MERGCISLLRNTWHDAAIDEVRKRGDSCGGVVTCVVRRCPKGLGSPVFDKLEAELAKALMSLPATKASLLHALLLAYCKQSHACHILQVDILLLCSRRCRLIAERWLLLFTLHVFICSTPCQPQGCISLFLQAAHASLCIASVEAATLGRLHVNSSFTSIQPNHQQWRCFV